MIVKKRMWLNLIGFTGCQVIKSNYMTTTVYTYNESSIKHLPNESKK